MRNRESSSRLWPSGVRVIGDLDAHVGQTGDAPRPVSVDRGSPFELEAELGKESDSRIERLHDDADVVHPWERHAATLSSGVASGTPVETQG